MTSRISGGDDDALRNLLSSIDGRGREILRRLMRADQQERDAFAEELLRHGNAHASDPADLIDSATIHPDMRRRLARVLGELEAESSE